MSDIDCFSKEDCKEMAEYFFVVNDKPTTATAVCLFHATRIKPDFKNRVYISKEDYLKYRKVKILS